MSTAVVLFLLGRIALLNGIVLLVPFAAALWWREPAVLYFGPSFLSAVALGLLFSYAGRRHKRQIGVGEGASYMVLVWILLGCIGMLPYCMAEELPWVDAFFESIAAYTTTGTSCLPAGTVQPLSLLFWHRLMEWMGGLNFLILFVTVIPQVSGTFGMAVTAQQYLDFSPVVRRMHSSAVQAGKIYLGLTAVTVALFAVAGLAPFEAVTRALMTVSTSGGDSAFDFLHNDNIFLELAAMAAMTLASGNFLLYWKGVRRHEWKSVFANSELRAFVTLLFAAGTLVSLHLWHGGVYSFADSVRYGFFHVVSFISTSGFMAVELPRWPEFDRLILFLLVFAGGCIGSATGGLRVVRLLILARMAAQEMLRTLHPKMVVTVKIDGNAVPARVIGHVLSFFFLFIVVFFVSMLVISVSGLTPLQAMGIAAGCLSSVGSTADLYGVADFSALPVWTKIYCSFLMILGRIEIFSFFIMVQTGLHQLRHRW
ncbi:TrkH family potassium uptake protein [Megasphaera vaginalis (ex Bordigoni et al. 2020)]|nr:potassium transporter TrkG [Megasphaera vaginalis (ex Bordigoni et al. 2020)]